MSFGLSPRYLRTSSCFSGVMAGAFTIAVIFFPFFHLLIVLGQ